MQNTIMQPAMPMVLAGITTHDLNAKLRQQTVVLHHDVREASHHPAALHHNIASTAVHVINIDAATLERHAWLPTISLKFQVGLI